MYLEAIKLKQKKVFNKLKAFPKFYLAGGTALALQIGHRISIDFDLFWPVDLPANLLTQIKKIFPKSKIQVTINQSEQLTLTLDNIQVTFLKYPYPLVLKLVQFKGVKFLPVAEIAVCKAFALGRRATFKDYIDLYFILKQGQVTLAQIISLGEKKYQEEFNGRLFLEQLIYLQDVEEAPIEFLQLAVAKQQLEDFFRRAVQKIKL